MAARAPRKPRGFVLAQMEQDGADLDASSPTPQVSDMLDELTDEGQRQPEARISRLDPFTKKLSFLETVDPSQVDDGWMRENYGGGEYRVMVYGTREDGSFGYLKKQSKFYRVDSSIPFKGAIRERVAAGAINAEPVASSPAMGRASADIMNMGIMQLFKSMQDNSAIQMQMMKDASAMNMAALERMARPTESQLPTLLAALSPLIAPFLSGMVNRKDPMEIATQLAELMKGANAPRESVKDMIETFSSLMEMRGMMNGEKSDEVTLLGTVKDLAPNVLDVLKSFAQRPAAAVPPPGPARIIQRTEARPQLPPIERLPSSGPAREVAPLLSVEGMPAVPTDEWTALEGPMQQLIAQARTNKPPHRVAGMVLLFASEEQQATLREVVAQSDVAEVITARFPEFQKHQVWLGEFVDCLRDEFGLLDDEGDDEVVTPDGSPADGESTE